MRPTPRPSDDTAAELATERLADLDDRLGGHRSRGDAEVPSDGTQRVRPEQVDLLLRLHQAGAAYRERSGSRAFATSGRFGRFEIVRESGRGGFATVYEAIDTFLGRRIALKIAHPEALLSTSLRQRFIREAELAAQLEHPHLLTIHEVGECDGLVYIAEEFCDGGTLGGWLERHPGPVAPRLSAAIVLAVAEGLKTAHARGISHRDIKPENILLARGGERPVIPPGDGDDGCTVKLCDFGLGKMNEEVSASTPLVQLTREGTPLGTPAWMAPEQVDRAIGPLGPATDVHALGLLLHRLLGGRDRCVGMSDSEALRHVLLHDPDAEPPGMRGVPADLVAVCRRCRARRPVDRYASAEGVASELARFLAGLPTVARPLTPYGRAWRFLLRHPAAVAIATAALVVIALVMFGLRERARQQAEIAQSRQERQRLDAALEMRRGVDMTRTGKIAAAFDHLQASAEIDPSLAGSYAGRWMERRTHGEVATLLAPPPAEPPDDGVPSPRRDLHCLALAPDGAMVAAGGADGRLHLLWLSAPGGPVSSSIAVVAHDEINDVAFSPDGALVATAGEDGRVRIFRAADGALVRQMTADEMPLFAVAFTPDGSRLAWGGTEQVIRVAAVEAEAVERPREIRPFGPGLVNAERDVRSVDAPDIESLLFVDDGRLAVAFGSRVVVVAVDDGSVEVEFPFEDRNGVVSHLVLSPDRSRLLTGGSEAIPRVWEVATGRPLLALPRHSLWIQGVAFTPDGRWIVTGCKDGLLRVFDARTGTPINRLAGHVGRLWEIGCEPGGTVLSVGADGTLRRWDPARQAEHAGTRSLSVAATPIVGLVPAPVGTPPGDGAAESVAARRSVLAGTAAGPLFLVDTTTGAQLPVTPSVDGPVPRMSVNPSGDLALVHRADGAVLLHAFDGRPARTVPGIALGHSSAWIDERRAILSDFQSTLWFHDASLDRSVKIEAAPHFIDAIALSPVDRRQLVAGGGNVVRAYSLPAGGVSSPIVGRPLARFTPDFGKVYRLAWSHDGRLIAVGSGLGRVCVIDAVRGTVIGTYASHFREVVGMAWSPDDRLLVTADNESVRVSDTGTTMMIDELRPGFEIQGIALVGGDTPWTGSRLVIGGGIVAEPDTPAARLVVIDLDAPPQAPR